jgi:hypothetical protein
MACKETSLIFLDNSLIDGGDVPSGISSTDAKV